MFINGLRLLQALPSAREEAKPSVGDMSPHLESALKVVTHICHPRTQETETEDCCWLRPASVIDGVSPGLA